MSFRRPILRGNYRWKRTPKPGNSLRYESMLDGAVRVYPDGREVCQDSPKGYAEYKRRLEIMLARQDGRCCLCGDKLHRNDATFEHQRRRGMAAAFRDDRVRNEKGEDINGAAHWICNVERG